MSVRLDEAFNAGCERREVSLGFPSASDCIKLYGTEALRRPILLHEMIRGWELQDSIIKRSYR
jgi:hypothetical protein